MKANYFDEENKELNSNGEVNDSYPLNEDEELAKVKAEKEKVAMKPVYAFYGKWIWYLFILIVPNIIGAIFSAVDSAPILVTVGGLITSAVSIAYVVFLIILGKQNNDYKIAGYVQIPSFVFNLIGTFMFMGSETPIWWNAIECAAALLAVYGLYLEIKTHAAITAPVDSVLSEKWTKILKWAIICFAIFAAYPLIALVPVLGVIVLVAAAIGVIVISILKLIYLYQTAKLFQSLAF